MFRDKTDNSRLFSNAVVTDRLIVFFFCYTVFAAYWLGLAFILLVLSDIIVEFYVYLSSIDLRRHWSLRFLCLSE